MTIENTIGFYSVKIISIFIVSIIYFIVGSVASILLNDNLPDKEKIQNLSTFNLILFSCSIFGGIGVLYYFLRLMVKKIPFFLDGLYGFKYLVLKEVSGGIIVGFVMYKYLDKLHILLNELHIRIKKLINKENL